MVLFPLIAGIIAMIYAAYLAWSVLKEDEGNDKMKEIARAIREGAKAYLNRQYKTIFIFAVIIAIILAMAINWQSALGFIVGAALSALAGYIGMNMTVQGNVRTANKAKDGLAAALSLAFKGGAVNGFSIVGLAIIGLSIFYILFGDPTLMVGFGFGACLISLFARVGGGIYTKAADVGADLVGKVEAGIPEDDPRNPAVIADNVGDAVGDCAGMGADLFETYVVTALAAMLLGASPAIKAHFGTNGVILPLIIGGIAIFATIIGTLFVRLGKSEAIMNAMYKGVIVTTIISIIAFYFANFYLTNGHMGIYISSIIGLLVMAAMVAITEYFTSYRYNPVLLVAEASKSGAGINVIAGLGIGLKSTFPPAIVIVIAIIISYFISGGATSSEMGVYGISIAAAAMLSATGIIVSIDSYGPITDNAGGIAEMAGLPEDVRKVTDKLDAVGNTTKAVTKGYAIGSAALAALSLFAAYRDEIAIRGFPIALAIDDPLVLVGLMLGAAVPFIFASYLMMAVGKAAFQVVEEVRRQFREIKGILEGTAKPDYGRAVDIVTKAALKEMMIPGIIAVGAPLLTGFLLGYKALGGMLMGSIASGLLLALLMTTGGAAWDNAKKYIELGNFGGKRSSAHVAAVVGDTVGDAFKDTAGPAINPLIKVMNTIAILFLPLILLFALF
ncbi:MAG: sodium-translocating pyrophosphatase [Candidatus Methanomethyliaceae archaeon]|nr:sodium-translocating pyrophosphatase [Candidatus Methanomethyliaceae archaeon]MDW7970597.1 sodium-translocating pyrophosphatase [Nitrososphaerota archaeon]